MHPAFKRITEALARPNWQVLVVFEGGERRIYDMSWVLQMDGELARALHSQEYFEQVRVENDTITWPNGFDVDPAWVYVESVPEEQAASGN